MPALPPTRLPPRCWAIRRCATSSGRALNALARQSTGGSTRICRLILMAEPPSLDAGEATDKGSINQRAVLTRRAALVEELYAGTPSGSVIAIDERT